MKCIVKHMKLLSCMLVFSLILSGCTVSGASVTDYETGDYKKTAYKADGYSASLCVATDDVNQSSVDMDSGLHAAGLFDVTNKEVLYASNIHKKLYPASTTKILTALIALKYGNLSDTIT